MARIADALGGEAAWYGITSSQISSKAATQQDINNMSCRLNEDTGKLPKSKQENAGLAQGWRDLEVVGVRGDEAGVNLSRPECLMLWEGNEAQLSEASVGTVY
eukprot:1160604-Pelagomonas_calceolata.AAC.1